MAGWIESKVMCNHCNSELSYQRSLSLKHHLNQKHTIDASVKTKEISADEANQHLKNAPNPFYIKQYLMLQTSLSHNLIVCIKMRLVANNLKIS